MFATHLREVHYQLTITCDLCKSFASMSAQSILEHHTGCKTKCTKRMHRTRRMWGEKVTQEELEGAGPGKSFLKLVWVTLMNPAGWNDAWDLLSNSADECGLILPWDLPKSFWPCVPSAFSLNCMNCYVFVSNNMFIVPWYFDFPFCPMFFFFYSL